MTPFEFAQTLGREIGYAESISGYVEERYETAIAAVLVYSTAIDDSFDSPNTYEIRKNICDGVSIFRGHPKSKYLFL